MTDEEKQQVQNLINARTKLLTEKAAQQEEQIKSLSDTIITLSNTIESREREIDGLKSQLSDAKEELSRAQEQSQKLLALVQSSPETPATIPAEPPKPNYLLSLLRQHFGYDSFRPGQEEIIDALLSGRDVFCSMPDGYGRNVCYRLPALLMPGLTLAVAPNDTDDSHPDQHSETLTPSLTPAKRQWHLQDPPRKHDSAFRTRHNNCPQVSRYIYGRASLTLGDSSLAGKMDGVHLVNHSQKNHSRNIRRHNKPLIAPGTSESVRPALTPENRRWL